MRRWRTGRLLFWTMFVANCLIMLAGLTQTASAHLTPNSELVLDFRDGEVVIDAIIPEGDFRLASGAPAGRDPAWAERWLAGQVSATTEDGRPWRVTMERSEFVQRAGPPDLHAIIRLTPPLGASARKLRLRWSAVVGQTPDHFALVLIGHDHGANILPQDRRLIGAVRGDRMTITVDRGQPSRGAAFAAAFRLGMTHLAEGTDHLLFLLTLLLTAPLVASSGRWTSTRPALSALARLAKVITAFTLGHSLTLVIAAIASWHLPVQPVEMLIALSILIAAIHAIRPVFAGREAWVAAGFGLIHGLAFATLVGEAGIGGQDRLVAILGFNLGIEAVQLLVAGLAFGPLMLIARTPDYRPLRIVVAVFAGVAAIAWLLERGTGTANGVASAVAALAGQPLWLMSGLLLLMSVALCRQWQRGKSAVSISGSAATSGPSMLS